MNIFKKSLTKKFYWNKNYTKSSNMQGSSSSGWWGLLAFRRAIPCEMVGQSLVIYLSRIRVKRAMRIWTKEHQSCHSREACPREDGERKPRGCPWESREREKKSGSPDDVRGRLGPDGNQGGTTNLKTTHLDLQTLRILGKSEDDRRVSSFMASFGRQWE